MQCTNYTSSSETLLCNTQHKSRVVLTTDLPLNQLVYTSFANVGFKLLTSEKVPKEIQQIFLNQIVNRYSNADEHQNLGSTTYILQIAPESWLFGWLYHQNDTSHNHIPYFHCYYLAEPLYTLRIEKVCACLQKGPIALVERHNCEPLEPLVLKDLNQYQAAKPGVVIPWEVREQIYANLKQEKLIDIFISAKNVEGKVVTTLSNVLTKKEDLNETKTLRPPALEQLHLSDRHSDIPPESPALLLRRNYILLLGISLGAATSIAVIGLFYLLFNQNILVPEIPTQPELNSPN
ncbi:hypothetical protein [Iningainema tapete]|uniref:Uncharacterized protein n=1 Tax=Iningainema tapete BLCC-T55 TaxID=2748662 RepID=A0A8J6XNV2_9CYAN|nr:hypothetical protein [Iningainema tapete]MBD2778553.1 hypothetical protein [Iningainema tapete BLCC-T55]